ncbi:hypothetical protein N7504_004549 [Penicillium tannophilum]|nr:hypothetical protein N7504_004549 [Penicillium tannophilum]
MSDQDPRVVLGMTALLVGVAMLLKEEENQSTRGQHWIGKDGAKPTKWVAAKKICSCPAPRHAAEKWPVSEAEIANQADVFGSLTVAAGKAGPSSELQTPCYED